MSEKNQAVPIPYEESDVEEVFWPKEDFDKVIPQGGWIGDFVLHYRGNEAPTKYCVWVALSVLSMIMKRDCYMWDRTHYPNLYVALVGPPRLNAKGFIINQGEKVWRRALQLMPPKMRGEKTTRVVHSAITIQSISEYFEPYTHLEPKSDGSGECWKIQKGTEVAMIIGELSTMLGKEKYNEGKIMKLTDFYDCKDYDDDITISRGHKVMKNIYVTILGGTTRGNIAKTIPEEAFSTGFMSRLILVDQQERLRSYPRPRPVRGGPDKESLAKRLAWVAGKSSGEYYFTNEAWEYYAGWYTRWFGEELPSKDTDKAEMYHRFDIHLLKLAMIIRAQRYAFGTDITRQDIIDAEMILRATYKRSWTAISQVGNNQFIKDYGTIKEKLLRCEWIERVDLVRHASAYHINAMDLNRILYQLKAEENIGIIRDGEEQENPSSKGKEVYKWIAR